MHSLRQIQHGGKNEHHLGCGSLGGQRTCADNRLVQGEGRHHIQTLKPSDRTKRVNDHCQNVDEIHRRRHHKIVKAGTF